MHVLGAVIFMLTLDASIFMHIMEAVIFMHVYTYIYIDMRGRHYSILERNV